MIAAAVQRPRFLLDLAEELNWLNERAGPEVANRWYEAVCSTIEQAIREIHTCLAALNKEAAGLAGRIQENFQELGI